MASDNHKVIIAVILAIGFVCYTGYIYSALPGRHKMVTAKEDAGKALWQKHNCTACHQIYGLGGFLGPDLTNVYSQKGEGYIRAFLGNGNLTMPAYDLSEEEILAFLSYLKHVDESGISDPRSFRININGTIKQE